MLIKVLASGSSGNCYLIDDGSSMLLLDAGIPLKQIKIGVGFKLSAVAGALITHRHGDHAKAVPELIGAGVNVYALQDVFEAKRVNSHRTIKIQDMQKFMVGTFSVLPFSVHHDVPNVGFYIHSNETNENLLYFTDTYYIEQIFPNLHYILAECNYDPEAIDKSIQSGKLPLVLKNRLIKSHMSIDTFIEMLKANDLSRVRQIYLLHLSDRNSRAEEFKARVQEQTGCEVYIA